MTIKQLTVIYLISVIYSFGTPSKIKKVKPFVNENDPNNIFTRILDPKRRVNEYDNFNIMKEAKNVADIYNAESLGDFDEFLKSKAQDIVSLEIIEDYDVDELVFIQRSLFTITFYNHRNKRHETYLVKQFIGDDGSAVKKEVQTSHFVYFTNLNNEDYSKMSVVMNKKGVFETDYYLFIRMGNNVRMGPVNSQDSKITFNIMRELEVFGTFVKILNTLKPLHDTGFSHNYLTHNSVWMIGSNFVILTNFEFADNYGRQIVRDQKFNPTSVVNDTIDTHYNSNAMSDAYSLLKVFLLISPKYRDKSFIFEGGNMQTLNGAVKSFVEVDTEDPNAFLKTMGTIFFCPCESKTTLKKNLFEEYIIYITEMNNSMKFDDIKQATEKYFVKSQKIAQENDPYSTTTFFQHLQITLKK